MHISVFDLKRTAILLLRGAGFRRKSKYRF